MKVYDAVLLYDFLLVGEAVFGECRCFVGIELVSETTDEERSAAEGVKPDLVQGIEFAYTLPASDLVVIFTNYFFFPPQFAAFCRDSSLANCTARSRLPIKFGCVVPNAAKCKTKQTRKGQIFTISFSLPMLMPGRVMTVCTATPYRLQPHGP